MGQLFLIAIRNIFQHGRRSLMLGGAIAGVTTLLVVLTSLSAGVKNTLLRSATTVSTGYLNVSGYYKITAGQSAPMITGYQKVEDIVKQTLPDLNYVAPRGRGWATLVSDQGNVQCAIAGIDIDHEPGLHQVLELVDGKLDDLKKPGTMLIFESQAKKLKVKVGDSIVISVLTPRGENNTVDVRIVGIATDMGILSSFNVFVPDQTLRQLYQLNDNSTGALLVYTKDMSRIPQDMDLLRKALASAGYIVMDHEAKAYWMKMQDINNEDWTGQKLDITNWEDEISFISWTLHAIDGITVVLTMVLLVIIAIGIMNSLYIAIRERTREIGTLRAIGMQRTRVMLMFVIEAFSLGTLGTFAGVLLGCALALFFNSLKVHVPDGMQFFLMSNTLRFSFDAGRILGSSLVIIACTTAISVIPSFRAALMKPVTAMSHIG